MVAGAEEFFGRLVNLQWWERTPGKRALEFACVSSRVGSRWLGEMGTEVDTVVMGKGSKCFLPGRGASVTER